MPQIQHLPVAPIPELDEWTRQLEAVAKNPLEFCEDFPAIAGRFEAWWNHDVDDRPIFLGTANTNPARPITRRLDLLTNPSAWFDAKLADLRQTYYAGDALPHIRTDFGPVLLGGMLGGHLEFGADTGWTKAFIDDNWSNAPDWRLEGSNPWWRLLRELTNMVARDAAGRYLVCSPDLGASADVLLNLRGSQQLCMDVMVNPDLVRMTADAIYPAWWDAFTCLYRDCLPHGAGLIHWLWIWSNRPYHIPACDFNFMIGPEQFNSVCLPDIARQAATVDRAVFHLDGPGAARHIDALLEVSSIQAIQFTPGEGTPSALAWAPMLKKIQEKGRSLYIFCPANEVLELCNVLSPKGLAIALSTPLSPEALAELFESFRTIW
ncbi:MAG: hypothetical protein IT365_03925 [Candidatus Hydrogenedentes bacterium]|nr:hypothetical protein [Candidatus Hydrogenedentota bacterium]